MSVRPQNHALAQPGGGRPALPFTAPWLLAPMEGITDPAFRDAVLRLHRPEDLGGVTTEFLRVSEAAISGRVIGRHVGPHGHPMPVVLQLMGQHPEHLAETARRAVGRGIPMIDLNCGCPAKGALRGCAGSALLDDPPALGRLVQALVDAVPGVPVSAKIRSGGEDASRIEELARAVEEAGASLLTVHYRTRAEAYCEEVWWDRIARAVAAVSIPVCGNGSVQERADLERMRRETGCHYVMVGRGALADPWLFGGHRARAAEAARFLLGYSEAMRGKGAGHRPAMAARTKQLLHHWTAGGILTEAERGRWLRERDPDVLFGWLEALAAGGERV